MADAFRCDRCGEYYDKSTNHYKYDLSKYFHSIFVIVAKILLRNG